MVDGGEDNVTFQGWDRAPYSNGFLRLFPHRWDIDIERQDLLSASGRDFSSTIPNPISGTVWLLASGLLVMVGIRRRKRLDA